MTTNQGYHGEDRRATHTITEDEWREFRGQLRLIKWVIGLVSVAMLSHGIWATRILFSAEAMLPRVEAKLEALELKSRGYDVSLVQIQGSLDYIRYRIDELANASRP